jgi:multidrug efflux pump
MNLGKLSVSRPVLIIVLNLIIIIFGLIGYKFLGVREYPAIDPPVITIRTNYTGANPDIVESQITEPLEKSINSVEGIKTLSSSSNLGSSIVTVEFELGSNLEQAANDVRDKVSQTLRSLPQDIDGPPVVSKADANSDPIIILNLQSESRSILEINDWAENIVATRFQTIPGVSGVNIFGGKRYSIRLRLNPNKLSAYNLTIADVKSTLDKENLELPAGKITGSVAELQLKTNGRLKTVDDFNNLIIKTSAGNDVKIRDVGFAEISPENNQTSLRVNNNNMVGLGITPQPGANYLDIAAEFYKRYNLLLKELPSDLKLFVPIDNTPVVRNSISEVKETLGIAILLVILVIYFFFRDWLVAFRPLIDIPVSLIGAFFIMYVFGFSINILTLLAIVLATGLVVDDGIVVTENIYKKIEKGMPHKLAVVEGTNEIVFAIFSTSITLAVVFLPIIFLEGFTGRLFREFGIVIAGAVLISAFVSLTLTPMLNAYLVRKEHKRSKFYEATEPFFENLDNSYSNSLSRFLSKKWISLLVLSCSFIAIYYYYHKLPSELAPLEDRSGFRLSVTLPEGTSFEYTDEYMRKISAALKDSIPECENMVSVTSPGFVGSGAVNTGFIRIRLIEPNKRKSTQQDIVKKAMKIASKFNDAKVIPIQEQTISVGLSSRFGLPVQFVIQGQNFDLLREKIPLFMEEVSKHTDVFQGFDVNLKFNKPELNVDIDRDKARSMGLNVQNIAQTLQLTYGGVRWGYYPFNGKLYQVIGEMEMGNRNETNDLQSLYLKNDKGQMIQMSNVVQINEQSSPPQIYHYNRQLSATVSAGLQPGKTIGDGIKVMESIAKTILDERFSTTLAGPSRDFAESESNTSFVFLLSLLLIYLILSAQFESFIDPLIIMFTVPLALAGALFSLWYFNQSLNIFSQIGMVMLLGLVTKNGILIVEFANTMRSSGMDKIDAIREASKARLRPILMTSIATILGALPIAFALGAGGKSKMSMGIVIVGGLLISLILTLYIIPAMYMYLSKSKPTKSEV